MKLAIFLLTLLFISNIPSIYYGWYLQFTWFDTAQHFLGGFFVAMLMVAYLKDHLIKGEWIKNTLVIAGATIFIGVVWEFAEYIANQTLAEPLYRWAGIRAYFMGDLDDTVKDLILDTLGGLSFWAIHSFRSRDAHQAEADFENAGNSPAKS